MEETTASCIAKIRLNSQKTEECYFLPGDEVVACSFSFEMSGFIVWLLQLCPGTIRRRNFFLKVTM